MTQDEHTLQSTRYEFLRDAILEEAVRANRLSGPEGPLKSFTERVVLRMKK